MATGGVPTNNLAPDRVKLVSERVVSMAYALRDLDTYVSAA